MACGVSCLLFHLLPEGRRPVANPMEERVPSRVRQPGLMPEGPAGEAGQGHGTKMEPTRTTSSPHLSTHCAPKCTCNFSTKSPPRQDLGALQAPGPHIAPSLATPLAAPPPGTSQKDGCNHLHPFLRTEHTLEPPEAPLRAIPDAAACCSQRL